MLRPADALLGPLTRIDECRCPALDLDVGDAAYFVEVADLQDHAA